MSLVSLPTITEQQFSAYLSANLSTAYQKATPDGPVTSNYSVTRSFTIQAYELPLIVAKAGKFSELEPGTNVYEGQLAISVITQADDTIDDPVTVHDSTVAQVYDLLVDPAAVASGVAGSNYHLWSFINAGYDQEVTEADNKRALVSVLEYRIHCQTLPVA